MALPPRAYYPVQELPVRWGCQLEDLAGWAATGRFDLLTAIEPMMLEGQALAGFVAVAAADIISLFRRDGCGPQRKALRRVRPQDSDSWHWFPEERHQIEVELADLFVMARDVHAFELEHELMRRAGVGAGSPSRYDWEGLYAALIRRVHLDGLPATQGEWISGAQDWFAEHSVSGEVPDERTVRRRLGPIWKMLQAA